VDENGQQLGIITREQALAASRQAGLDLVEVAPLERPPVCRIMDFGKFKYEQKKKASKQKTHRIVTKEIRVHPKTGDHDVMVKVNHAREFLQHKDKVLLKVEFRGREIAHIEHGHGHDAQGAGRCRKGRKASGDGRQASHGTPLRQITAGDKPRVSAIHSARPGIPWLELNSSATRFQISLFCQSL
jgi:translation initiation factor IF-3